MENYIINTAALQITESDFFIRMLVALGIGFVIGLEREHAAQRENIHGFAGVRTFILVALSGFMAGMAYFVFNPAVYLGILFCVAVLIGISYYMTAKQGDIGSTTEFSVIISFLLGSLTFLGFLEISLMVMVVVVILLSAKVKLRSVVGEITTEELYDFIRFVVIALLLFPFVPDQSYGPYNVINPHEVGWVILLTSGLGLVGYVLMKFLGAQKGILLSGMLGGLVSSTAVTWVFAVKSKEHEGLSQQCAVAIMAASSMMILRILVWTFLFNKILFDAIFASVLLVFVSGIAVTLFYLYWRKGEQVPDAKVPLGKPLDIQSALVFGGIYVLILLLVSYANEQLGDKGLMVSSIIAGLSDIDAITISMSKLAGKSIEVQLAGNAVLVGAISNTVVKMGIGIKMGSPMLRRYLYVGYGIVLLTALLVLLFIHR